MVEQPEPPAEVRQREDASQRSAELAGVWVSGMKREVVRGGTNPVSRMQFMYCAGTPIPTGA